MPPESIIKAIIREPRSVGGRVCGLRVPDDTPGVSDNRFDNRLWWSDWSSGSQRPARDPLREICKSIMFSSPSGPYGMFDVPQDYAVLLSKHYQRLLVRYQELGIRKHGVLPKSMEIHYVFALSGGPDKIEML